MKIFKVERTDSYSYDDYDSFVCFANTADEARRMCPDDYYEWIDDKLYFKYSDGSCKEEDLKYFSWTSPDNVEVTELNPEITTEASIILASYNAG